MLLCYFLVSQKITLNEYNPMYFFFHFAVDGHVGCFYCTDYFLSSLTLLLEISHKCFTNSLIYVLLYVCLNVYLVH